MDGHTMTANTRARIASHGKNVPKSPKFRTTDGMVVSEFTSIIKRS